jgi:hypothetical protein
VSRHIKAGESKWVEKPIGVTHGLIGPKLEPGGWFRPVVTLKAGFVDFRLSPSLSSGLLPSGAIVSSILGLRTSNLNAAI